MTTGNRGANRRQRIVDIQAKATRRLRFVATPETVLGALIVGFWAVAATLSGPPRLVLLLALVIGLGLHLVAVDSGNFIALGATTGFVLLLIIASTRSLLADADPLIFTLAGASALIHSETVRVGYARRRRAVVSSKARMISVVGMGLAVLVAVVAVGVSKPLAELVGQRSWYWMPAAALVVALVVVGFAVVPTIGAPDSSRDRWQPGDRLPPPG